MDKLTDSQLSKLQEYLQSHREKNSLSLKIKFNVHQNLPILQVIQEELARLTHLTDLTLHISKHTILTNEGYRFLSDSVLTLKALKKLSIKIDQSCFLENEGLSILQDMINNLPELVCLKIKIRENNYIKQESAQQLLDSLSVNTKLTTLNLHLENIQNSITNEGNIHFWRGISNLINLESLKIYLNVSNYDSQDLTELFALITQLKKLRSLHLILQNGQSQNTDLLIELFTSFGQIIELSSLKVKYLSIYRIRLSDTQRETILRNLSNLKFLGELKLYSIEQVLFNDSLEEYINLIRNLKYLKGLQLNIQNNQLYAPDNIMSLGKSLFELNNLVNLEFVFGLKGDELWRGFLQDLSVSFSKMHNLLSLKLEFQEQISSKACDILGKSFKHLKQLIKFYLKLTFSVKMIKLGLLSGIHQLTNLKELEMLIKDDSFEEEEVTVLLDSIIKLKQLEKLRLQLIDYSDNSNYGIWNLEGLCNTLMNLSKLKYLSCGVSIFCLEDDYQLEMLEKCFENLKDLEYLELDLLIVLMNDKLQNRSLIQNLTNLKKLVINFPNLPLNIFGTLTQSEQKLDCCQLTFQNIRDQTFIEIIELLSQLTIRKLNLTISSKKQGFSQYKKQFGIACSNMCSLEKLSILDQDRNCKDLMTFVHGIKQMKQLKSLSVQSQYSALELEVVLELNETLKQLNNLQKVTFEFQKPGYIHGEVRDIFSLKSLKSFGNLKHFSLGFWNSFKGEYDKVIHSTNTCSLDLQQRNLKSLSDNSNQIEDFVELQNQVEFEQQQISLENQLKLDDSQQKTTKELNPIEIKINTQYQDRFEQKISLNEFDFQNSRYLNHLEIQCGFSENTVQLELLKPFRDMTSESKLMRLELQFLMLILNEEQISYLSRNFKFLTNLEHLKFSTSFFQDYYDLFFDSFKYLVNLKEITVETNISDNGAVALGNSLKAMNNLQICELKFERSSFRRKGISSILNGLKHAARLIHLSLRLYTDQVFENEDSSIPFSDCISRLKYLEKFYFSLAINHIDTTCLRDFFNAIGSLISLNQLILQMSRTNALNQEMLDDLTKALNKSQVFDKNIYIFLQNGKQISLSEDFANIFNKTKDADNELTIIASKYDIYFKQSFSLFTIKPENFDNLEVNFLEYLQENNSIFLKIQDIKIFKSCRICPSRKIELKSLELSDEQDVVNVCGFILKMVNIFELEMEISLSNSVNIEDSVKQIAESLTKLKTLKVLNLKFYFKNDPRKIMSQIMTALKTLKKMGQLQELYLKTKNPHVNEQLIPIIQRSILRQVKFDFSKQKKSD